jgi:hypothetical protein
VYCTRSLGSAGNVPQSLGAPDRRSRIISTDPDHVFHSRVVQLSARLKNEITSQFEKIISEWIGQPVVYSAGFGARTYLRNATFAAHVDRKYTHALTRTAKHRTARACACARTLSELRTTRAWSACLCRVVLSAQGTTPTSPLQSSTSISRLRRTGRW